MVWHWEYSIIIFLCCYVAIYVHGSKHERQAERGVRSYISTNGEIGFIRRATPMEEFMERHLHRSGRSCKCRCRSKVYNDGWHCCACSWTEKLCFPGSSTVTRTDGTTVKMAELRQGEKILTVNANGEVVPTRVQSFMQRNTTGFGLYLTLKTADGQQITLSKSHLVYSSSDQQKNSFSYKFAGDLAIGELLMVHSKNGTMVPKEILSTENVAAEGAYTPLTDHGSLLVDSIQASCYAGFDHELAHFFMSPMRWFPSYLDADPTLEGMRGYVKVMRDIGRWIFPLGWQDEASALWEHVHQLENAIFRAITFTFSFK